jgi:hypothetical protein
MTNSIIRLPKPPATPEELKNALVKQLIAEYSNLPARLVYQSVNEAYAMAAFAGEPLLFLPVLAEEKVRQAASWSIRQNALLHGVPLALAA